MGCVIDRISFSTHMSIHGKKKMNPSLRRRNILITSTVMEQIEQLEAAELVNVVIVWRCGKVAI